MFSLILSICISHAGFDVCEGQMLYEKQTKEQCLVAMDRAGRDVKASPFYVFEWELSCTNDETETELSN